MSTPDGPTPASPPDESPRLGPGGRIFVVLLGSILLLPGICTLIFIPTVIFEDGALGRWGGLWFIGFAISAVGVWLIRIVRRNR